MASNNPSTSITNPTKTATSATMHVPTNIMGSKHTATNVASLQHLSNNMAVSGGDTAHGSTSTMGKIADTVRGAFSAAGTTVKNMFTTGTTDKHKADLITRRKRIEEKEKKLRDAMQNDQRLNPSPRLKSAIVAMPTAQGLEYVLSLTGVQRNNIEVMLEGHTLRIRGARVKPDNTSVSFNEVVMLPNNARLDNVNATFRDGDLVISVPKIPGPVVHPNPALTAFTSSSSSTTSAREIVIRG